MVNTAGAIMCSVRCPSDLPSEPFQAVASTCRRRSLVQQAPVHCHSCPEWFQWRMGGALYMAHCCACSSDCFAFPIGMTGWSHSAWWQHTFYSTAPALNGGGSRDLPNYAPNRIGLFVILDLTVPKHFQKCTSDALGCNFPITFSEGVPIS